MRQPVLYILLQPLKKIIQRIKGKNDEDDDRFNHPYAIL
jgi:hypothetical protein